MPASTSGRGADAVTIERVVAYLGKRDGIDKLLKLAKYATGLGAEVGPDGERRLRDLETALSLSRKAFRLGKFLGNLQKIRDLGERERKRRAEALEWRKKDDGKGEADRAIAETENYFLSRRAFLALSLIANSSEGLYYFLDQMQFFVKAKVVRKSEAVKKVKKLAALAEMVSYLSDTILAVLEDAAGSGGTTNEACLRAVQNMADFFAALNDVREESGGLGHPKFLGVLGLVSALIGIRSKWVKK